MKEYLAGANRSDLDTNRGTIIMATGHTEAAVKAFSMRLSKDFIHIRGDGEDIAFKLHKKQFARQIS